VVESFRLVKSRNQLGIMTEPPRFSSQIDIADSPGESRVNFEARTKLSLPDNEVQQIVGAFVSAANFGMFSKEPAAAARTIQVESQESVEGGGGRIAWSVTGMQIGAYRVLLNMLEAAHYASKLLDLVRLTSAPSGGKRFSKDDLLTSPFPAKTNNPPFELRVGQNLAYCREPLIRLEFKRRISDEETARLFPPFLAWDNVVLRGGYLEDLEDRKAELDIEEELTSPRTYLAAPNTVEHLFYEFEGQAAAFDAVINMAIRLHHTFCPLAAFEIE